MLESVQIKKDRRQRKLKEAYERQTKRKIGQVGRPKAVTEEDRIEMLKMLEQGDSRYRIAQRFKTKYSKQTVYSTLRLV